MARLNEPPAPVETMESLKRRFMRQNRDIARANSAQSLRIRNLENETSRLLADNLELREQVLRLRLEIDDGRARRIADNTTVIKSQLELKMQEISTLINDLNQAPTPEKKPTKAGKLIRENPNGSPDQRNWRNMCTLSELSAGQEGRLPPIIENKSFPRKTLEQQEIMALNADIAIDTTDSPEIGPPPVSKFVDEDPVKIDLPSRAKNVERDESLSLDPPMSINLEQRKKRRDSIGGSESRRASKAEYIQGSQESKGALKVGAKRKMSVRDDEDNESSSKRAEESSGDFKFTRGVSEDKTKNTPSSLLERQASKVTKDPTVIRGVPREKSTSSTAIAARKVLAPKSVNNSPRKGSRATVQDGPKPVKPDNIKSKAPKEIKAEAVASSESMDQIILGEPEPETPAALDIFSPPESRPSTARPESRDTPPPPDLGPGSEGHRPSRRARASVSYAEPSLRDKMRRPTKELVDAVARDAKLQQNSIKLEGIIPQGANVDIQGLSIKTELEGDDSWKTMPAPSATTVENSPLGNKAPHAVSLPNTITTHRKRRESLLTQAEAEVPRSTSGNAIVALLASNRKARAEAIEKSLDNGNIPKGTSPVDIYEFRGSPPSSDAATTNTAKSEKTIAPRNARRHTTVSRDIALIDDSEASDMEVVKKIEGIVPRRRQSSIVPKTSSSASIESKRHDDDEKSLRKTTSTAAIGDIAAGGSRSDRIAARRRSMML